MKYRPSPFNILSAGLVLISIYGAIRPGPMGWGFLGLFYFLPIGIIGLFVDFFIQRLGYWRTFIIEFSFIGVLSIFYIWSQRTKTYIIPDNLRDTYIVTIYEVDGSPALPKHAFSWQYEIPFPSSGIFQTSSSMDYDLPETEIRTLSGIDLNDRTDSSDICFGFIRTSQIECGDKKYPYQIWKIDHGGTIGSTSTELDSVEKKLINILCERHMAQLVTHGWRHPGREQLLVGKRCLH